MSRAELSPLHHISPCHVYNQRHVQAASPAPQSHAQSVPPSVVLPHVLLPTLSDVVNHMQISLQCHSLRFMLTLTCALYPDCDHDSDHASDCDCCGPVPYHDTWSCLSGDCARHECQHSSAMPCTHLYHDSRNPEPSPCCVHDCDPWAVDPDPTVIDCTFRIIDLL